MRWLPFTGKKELNFVSFVEETVKELQKEPVKALFIYDGQWLPIYGYRDEAYFDGEFQEILQVMEAAENSVEKNIRPEVLTLMKDSLKYKIPFLAFRYGSFAVVGVREGDFFMVVLIDEFNGRISVDKIEKQLREKLRRVVERAEANR